MLFLGICVWGGVLPRKPLETAWETLNLRRCAAGRDTPTCFFREAQAEPDPRLHFCSDAIANPGYFTTSGTCDAWV